MCSHKLKKINDFSVCIKCGLTMTYDGKAFFDRDIVKTINRRSGKVDKKH